MQGDSGSLMKWFQQGYFGKAGNKLLLRLRGGRAKNRSLF